MLSDIRQLTPMKFQTPNITIFKNTVSKSCDLYKREKHALKMLTIRGCNFRDNNKLYKTGFYSVSNDETNIDKTVDGKMNIHNP